MTAGETFQGAQVAIAYARKREARRCSLCGISTSVEPVLRFGLRHMAQGPDGRWTGRLAGAVNLCQRCWARLRSPAEKRRKPRRAVA